MSGRRPAKRSRRGGPGSSAAGRRSRRGAILAVALAALALGAIAWRVRRSTPAPTLDWEVVRAFPHDPHAFTQGLIFRDGVLFESVGLNGRSEVRRVALETGEVLQRRPLDSVYFAEGLADWGDRLIQLTWKSGVGFVLDRTTLDTLRTFTYPGEGWGLARAENELIMSDGTASLRILDPETLAERRRIEVRDGGRPVRELNELELVEGSLLANVWQTNQIVRIDPGSGRVEARWDLTGLLRMSDRNDSTDVLNGIAWDAAGQRLFVTGKLWPKLFEVRLEDP